LAATRWILANAAALQLQANKIAIGGDSAGGNLSAVICNELNNANEPMPDLPTADLSRPPAR
jgi:acetyl esterase